MKGIEFGFSSGAGGWCTTMTIEDDGSFEGVYYDSDMGVSTDELTFVCLYNVNGTEAFSSYEKME